MTSFASAYFPLIECFGRDSSSIGFTVALPEFESDDVLKLVSATKETYRGITPQIEINGNVYIIGDLHGNFFDLLRILSSIDNLFEQTLLFLGDFVDRGSFSLDVVLLIFTLKCQFPDRVHLLRGNHEFREMNGSYGFRDEVIDRYESEQIWESVNQVFDFLPYVAIVNQKTFCVHGGIGPNTTLSKIHAIEIPLATYEKRGDIVTDLVWSDPGESPSAFLDSARGLGALFGRCTLLKMLKEGRYTRMVRAHQCVNGVSKKWNNLLYTVFSSSDYNHGKNLMGVIQVNENGEISSRVFPMITWPARNEVRYRMVHGRCDGTWRPMTFIFGSMSPSQWNVARPRIGSSKVMPSKSTCQMGVIKRSSQMRIFPMKTPALFSSPKLQSGSMRNVCRMLPDLVPAEGEPESV